MKSFCLSLVCLLPLLLGNGAAAAEPAIVTNSLGMKLAPIPAGEFLMGSSPAIRDAGSDERPPHKIRLTRPFHIGVYEVTQQEFREVMQADPSFFSPKGPGGSLVKGMDARRFPAEQIRFVDAVAFCRKLSSRPAEKKAGRFYRLPTEAEWEFACRGGTTTAFHFGDGLGADKANFNGKYPYKGGADGPFLARTTRVGSFTPNAFGLHDMHGNVWEWCLDWYGIDYYAKSPAADPLGPVAGTSRVIRGGGWYSDARDCRSSFRYAEKPLGVYYVMGFRVVMTAGASVSPELRQHLDRIDISGKAIVRRTVGRSQAPTREQLLALGGESWPRWRGPRGDGSWKGPAFPARWPIGGLRTLWRRTIGGGYSGIAAEAGRIYTLERPAKPTDTEQVICLDAATGKQAWQFRYPAIYNKLSYGNGPRATPAVHDNRVYTMGAVGHLHCLDASTGKRLWVRDLVKDAGAKVPLWGFSASPIIVGDLVIVHAGAKPNGCYLALDRVTGMERWRNVSDPLGYATPLLISSGKIRQLVCWTPTHVRGLDPRTGRIAWSREFRVHNGTAISMPLFRDGVVLVSGYWEGSQAIRLNDGLSTASAAWEDRRNLRSLMCQPLYRNGHGYLLDKRHGLTCFELASGKKLWDDDNRMTPKGRNPQATMVWLGQTDRAVVLNSDGELLLIRLSPKGFQELSRTRVIGETWAHPAYAWGCVYARNDKEIVCVEIVPSIR